MHDYKYISIGDLWSCIYLKYGGIFLTTSLIQSISNVNSIIALFANFKFRIENIYVCIT